VTSSIWPGWLALTLNVVGAAFVAYSILAAQAQQRPLWVLVVALIAVATWAARSVCALLGARRLAVVLAVVSAATGALATPATDGVAVVPTAISILVLVGDVGLPLRLGLGTAVGSVVLIVVGALPFDTPVVALFGELAGIGLATFAGLSRRQFRRAEQQAALLREREAAIREENARIALARDLHDLLAHSLGGLVVQLDAVEALLEAGDGDSARSRAVAARALAAEGLADARRAVAALRDPAAAAAAEAAAPADEEALPAALDDLLGAHRALGGTADLTVHGRPRPVSPAQAAALQRAFQEALSNARKHAPGQPVGAELDWQDDRVTLRISNPIAAEGVGAECVAAGRATAAVPAAESLARSGGGHGLAGMRERFSALPLGGTATAETLDGRFAVTVEARLA
jgi:signal transduction histidine kinase